MAFEDPQVSGKKSNGILQAVLTAGSAVIGGIKGIFDGDDDQIDFTAAGEVKIAGYNGTNYHPPKLDITTRALCNVDYEHCEIHSGSHYIIDDVVTLAINNVYDIQWTTPDTTKWGHFAFLLSCEAETEWYAYEGATISTAGTTITAYNNDRNSGNTSGMTIAGISNTSVANANSDTPVAGATQIAHGIIGAGRRSAGLELRSREIILKQDTIYCFRLVANAAGYSNFAINWYEHTNSAV